jgi:glycosyltransferase involved in cell wall biosynthesis
VTSLRRPAAQETRAAATTNAAAADAHAVVEVIWGPQVGGSETLAFNLARAWKAAGVPVRICCLWEKHGPLVAQFEAAGIAYDMLDIGHKPLYQRWWGVARYFWRIRPRAVHAHHFGVLLTVLPAALAAGCGNVVYTEHSSYLLSRRPWSRRAVPILARFVRKVTCVSSTLVEFFKRDLGVPAHKLVAVYNGVDTERFSPAPRNARQAERLSIGAVGRLVEEKDYDNLLRALALLRDRGLAFDARIVGEGPLYGRLHTLSQSLGLDGRVTFCGRRSDVPQLLREFDVYVLSSRHEGMPLAVLEAMATGLPIVSTAAGAVTEVITDGRNGLVVPTGDSAALADALARVAAEPALAASLAEAALADVRRLYSIQGTMARYSNLFGIAPSAETGLVLKERGQWRRQ